MSFKLKIIQPNQVQAFAYDPVDPKALIQAREICDDVKSNGTTAMLEHAVRLRDLETVDTKYIYNREDMKKVYNSIPDDQKKLLQRTRQRIQTFAKAQKESIQPIEINIIGGRAGQNISPMKIAGCYAPGGRYPLPSSVLMTAVTARTAGVEKVIVASPRPSQVTLAAAYISDADMFIAIGGAQVIAAMAYGCDEIPCCDIIVGPGNKWVTAAKSLVYGKCAIDMLAGPSECLVIADDSANASTIAADLLAQAEHDIAAVPILVSTSNQLIDQVNLELDKQLQTLSTAETAKESIQNGFAVLCNDMKTCIQVTDSLAPEHLEILTENPKDIASKVQHYGGLFIGTRAAEVFGDYGAGPNHVLPTGGTAKYSGGLSVHNFLRIRTWMCIDDAIASQTLVEDSAALARLEGLEGHARAAEKRLV